MSATEQPDRQQTERDDREERPYFTIEDKWKGEPPAMKSKLYDLPEDEALRIVNVAVAAYKHAKAALA